MIEAGKARHETIAIQGLGTVRVRSVTERQQRSRNAGYYDANGRPTDDFHLARLHQIIDQVLTDDGKPMFTDADIEYLESLDIALVVRITDALDEFNARLPEGNGVAG